ncbi:multisubunit sodium/proton antiporter, MrpB subunit [Desulfonatronum thiosulfatophilum]|uniref:Multisubunit sodium/proton antiporter, MrpB subunit n=1 Tax=Desulfonatronum thiosulfatophilum TaxID=617002 RepID=A0A1G6ENY0_9BACT|nr:hydrogenase subunit MbhD domain-containing protein [Desulfonatronum thiosulfatophilum]SDB59233.1 multisubunit sodium/proton antiporter, MrpB subunit [Desulfonatronum thiosulfatophilum]
MTLMLIFDVLLVGALLMVSRRLLLASDLFQATVLFVSFGLFLSLAWIRLQAPDIALAEAAVGAGLAGVLLFGTFKGIEPNRHRDSQRHDNHNHGDMDDNRNQFRPGEHDLFSEQSQALPCRLDQDASCPGRMHYLLAAGFVGLLTLLLVLTVVQLPADKSGLTDWAAQAMQDSGVEHPVTAVLLNFRLYDTWLELGVLILALVAVLAVYGRRELRMQARATSNPVLRWLVSLLTPIVLLVSVQLLWLGEHSPGGAFQAGVVLAAGLVLLRLTGLPSVNTLSRGALLSFVIVGFSAVLLLAAATSFAPRLQPLEFPIQWAKPLILVLESAATVSIGVTLASLVVHVLSGGRDKRNAESRDEAAMQ